MTTSTLPGVPSGPRGHTNKRDIPTGREAAIAFIAHRRAQGYKDIRNEINVLLGSDGRRLGKAPASPRAVALAQSLIGSTPMHRVTEPMLSQWFGDRCPADLVAPSTRKRVMATLRAFLDYSWSQGWIDEGALAAKQSLSPSSADRVWLKPEQLVAVGEFVASSPLLDDYERFIWDLLLHTGVRSAEAVDLRTDSLDPASLLLHVAHGKGPGAGKPRDVPVDAEFARRWRERIVRGLIPPGAPMIYHRHVVPVGGGTGEMRWEEAERRQPATAKVLRSMCDKLMTGLTGAVAAGRFDAGLYPPKIRPKVLRKTFACSQYILHQQGRGGLGIVELQHALGHGRLDTTQVYLADVHRWLGANSERVGTFEGIRALMLDAHRA